MHLPKNRYPHELSNIHLNDVSQCTSYLKENTVSVHHKTDQLNILGK